MPKDWCFWTVELEKTLEGPLDCKEIQPVHPKWYQPWIFIGRIDAEAEAPLLWPTDTKSWLIRKDPNVGKEAKGEGGDKGWDSQIASMDMNLGKLWEIGQGRLAWGSPWGLKESDTTQWLNNKNGILKLSTSFPTFPCQLWSYTFLCLSFFIVFHNHWCGHSVTVCHLYHYPFRPIKTETIY